jgi:hypothetical protein
MLNMGTMEDILSDAEERVLICLNLPTGVTEVLSTPGLE